MNRLRCMLALLAGLLINALAPAPAIAQMVSPGPTPTMNCQTDSLGRMICAPWGGSVVTDAMGMLACGRGQCIRDGLGRIVCSAVPGGPAYADAMGRPVCAGGCTPPSPQLCAPMR